MRLAVLLIVLCLLLPCGAPPSLAADAPAFPKSTPLALNISPAPQTAKVAQKWSRKKKLATAVLVGCVIAVSVAVPIAVSVHHQHQVRARSRLRRTLQTAIQNQEIVAVKQEQAVRSLLAGGPGIAPALTATQQAALQADLLQVKQAESALSQAYASLVLRKPLSTVVALDKRADALMGPSNVYAHEYDGVSDFPQYPINVLIDLTHF